MYKARYLLILVLLSVAFSDCKTYKPNGTFEDIDPSGTGYERVTKPYKIKRVSTGGAIFNVTFMGAGAVGGYLATAPSTASDGNGKSVTTYHDPIGITNGTDPNVRLYYAAGGLAVGYLVSRLFLLHSHKRVYMTQKEYPDWVALYNEKKGKDYLLINDPEMTNATSMMLLSKQRESQFKPRSLHDLRIFATLFPNSNYTDTAIIYANPSLTISELDTVISLYPDRGGVYASKVEYVGRFKTESDFKAALDKYKEAQAGDSIQARYAGLVQTYPYAKDFIIRYPRSLLFDDIYQQLYAKLPWDQLTTLIDLYPAIPDSRATNAKIQYFEMASTFHDLLNAVTRYPQIPYVVKPSDSLVTEDAAKNVFNRLVAYKPISPVNNKPKVLSNLPEEFLVIQNKTMNPDETDTLYGLANRPWVQTDSAAEIINDICIRYAKYKQEDVFIGVHLADVYDSGKFYNHDGSALIASRIKDKKDIVGFGERISSTGRKEIGNFEDGNLKGHGKVIFPNATIIEEGNFTDGRLEGAGGKMIHVTLGYIDSGIFHNDKLANLGMRTYSNGNRYVGNFFDAKFTGHGTFTWGSGKKSFTGNFTDGKRDGEGQLRFDSGYVVHGAWVNDCPDGEINISKQDKHRITESNTTWTINNCMVTRKEDTDIVPPFTDAEVLEKLPGE